MAGVDLTGQVFGKWTVIRKANPRPRASGTVSFHLCKCVCGLEKEVATQSLTSGASKCCQQCTPRKGRTPKELIRPVTDLVGKQFGSWTVIKFSGYRTTTNGNRNLRYLCRCTCGHEALIQEGNLLSGGSRRCMKCRNKSYSATGNPNYRHGHSSEELASPTYSTWRSVVERTSGLSNTFYSRAGIMVCQRWKDSFIDFLSDMGERPSVHHSIDRINKNEATRHYSCGKCDECKQKGWITHCRWATKAEQMNNRVDNVMIAFQGKTQTVAQWSRELGIKYGTIMNRLMAGKSPEQVLAPARKIKPKYYL